MPNQNVSRVPDYSVPPHLMNGGALGPATGANVVTVPIGIIPSVPFTVTRVVILPSAQIALDAQVTTFELEDSAGSVIASGDNTAAIPVTGLELTLVPAEVNLAVGTALRLVMTNQVGGQALEAVIVGVQVEMQPTA